MIKFLKDIAYMDYYFERFHSNKFPINLFTLNDYNEYLGGKGFKEYYIHELPKEFIINIYIKKIFFFKSKLEKEMNKISSYNLKINIFRII